METLAFLAKKTLSVFCYPLGTSLLLIAGGLLFWRGKPHRARVGLIVSIAGCVYLLIMSLPMTSFFLLRSLEADAGPYADPVELRRRGVQDIVTLGAEVVTDERTPADRMGYAIFRVMEGIRLVKAMPGARLIISAGSMPGRMSQVDAMAALPLQLGISKEALVLENRALDTEDEARLVARLVGDRPFGLVTTAFHMPRAIKWFRGFGLNPIPCPCEFKTHAPPPFYQWFFPGVGSLRDSTCAVHELAGASWQSIKLLFRRESATRREGGNRSFLRATAKCAVRDVLESRNFLKERLASGEFPEAGVPRDRRPCHFLKGQPRVFW